MTEKSVQELPVILVPQLPPAICGVGDYTQKLTEAWGNKQNWLYLVISGAEASQKLFPKGTVLEINQSDDGIVYALRGYTNSIIIVQFTVFGFDKLGIPLWLVNALNNWKNLCKENRIILMIHEVGGEAYPWQRGYYRIRKQLRILKLLGKLSDSVITSSKYNQQILNEICVPAITSVVPSNIEEGDNISLQQERWVDQKESNCFRVVVFGMQGKRIKTIKWHRFLLRELHEKRLLSEVVIIGKNFTQKDYSVREVEMLAKFIPKDSIKILGEQKSGAISLELSKSHILLSHFQINDFEKSGTIKAALAHGVVPILKGNADETHMIMEMFDGTRVGAKHLADKINMAYLSEMSKAGKARYSENYSWDKVVDVYKSVIQKMKNERVVNGLNQNNKNP